MLLHGHVKWAFVIQVCTPGRLCFGLIGFLVLHRIGLPSVPRTRLYQEQAHRIALLTQQVNRVRHWTPLGDERSGRLRMSYLDYERDYIATLVIIMDSSTRLRFPC